jgi:hypothetical protein
MIDLLVAAIITASHHGGGGHHHHARHSQVSEGCHRAPPGVKVLCITYDSDNPDDSDDA